MQRLYSLIVSRKNLRRLFAAGFAFCLLAEWGSHSLAFAHASSPEGMAVYSSEGGHEDPCKALIRCSDGRQQDQRVPNLGHDLRQHNAFFDRSANSRRLYGVYKDPRILRAKVNGLFRPPSPPFHPPELS